MLSEIARSQLRVSLLARSIAEFQCKELAIDLDLHLVLIVAQSCDVSVRILRLSLHEASEQAGLPGLRIANHAYFDG